MQRKLTITVSDDAYRGLRHRIGRGEISRFIESLVRPHVVTDRDLEDDYREALADQLRTVAKERLQEPMGSLSATEMLAVERAIRVQLGLP
jgi:hypothetical protein